MDRDVGRFDNCAKEVSDYPILERGTKWKKEWIQANLKSIKAASSNAAFHQANWLWSEKMRGLELRFRHRSEGHAVSLFLPLEMVAFCAFSFWMNTPPFLDEC